MALNWKSAQKNELKFWEDIYVKNRHDLVYSKSSDQNWIDFTNIVLKRNKISLKDLEGKVILDLGSGPAGVAKGLELQQLNGSLNFKKLYALDPLMNFFKEKIKILQESEKLKLYNSSAENIPLEDHSVDIIFCTNVLDHCDNLSKVIDEVKRVLKPSGIFFPSLHIIYDIWKPLKKFLKYFDTNHPHHFDNKDVTKILSTKFKKIEICKRVKIIEDQPMFTFTNIIKNKSLLRGVKRYVSNYILLLSYYKCSNI